MTRVWRWVLAAASAVAVVLGYFLMRKYQKDHVNTLVDALVVSKVEKEIAVLNAQREIVEQRLERREEVIQDIDTQLAENQRKIVEARTGAKDLDREAVLAEYRRLGYL